MQYQQQMDDDRPQLVRQNDSDLLVFVAPGAIGITAWTAERGRSLMAVRALQAGTALIDERPLIQWKRGSYDPVTVLNDQIVGNQNIIDALSELSPNWNDLNEIKRGQASAALSLLHQQLQTDKKQSFSTNTDNNKELIRLFYVLETNSFPSGLFPTIARCNHSCAPNARVIDMDDFYRLELIRDVNEGEEICISYVDQPETMTRKQRQRHLESQYLFECQCTACKSNSNEVFLCPACKNGKISERFKICDACGQEPSVKQWAKLEDRDDALQAQFNMIGNKIHRMPISSPQRQQLLSTFMMKMLATYHADHPSIQAVRCLMLQY